MSSAKSVRKELPSSRLFQRVPATYAQQRLWFLDQLQPGNLAYLIAWNIRLSGDLKLEALQNALEEIVRRHKVFRTTFEMTGGEVLQVVASSFRLPFVVEDLSLEADPEDAAKRISYEETQRPLDLVAGPLLRARLLHLSQTENILLLTLHHIIFDGSSRSVFIREFSALYDAFRDGRPSPLAAPIVQYADYAVWQRRSLQGKRYNKLLDYWKKQLADAPAILALPTDRPRPAIEAFRGATKHFALSTETSDKLGALAKQRSASMFMLLMAGFQSLLSKYCGQDDILVGIPVSGRTHTEFENLIGYFANQVVLRLKFTNDPSFEELIAQTKDVAFDAFEHQDMPLDRLVQELNPERNLSHNPLFQVLFSLRNYRKDELHLAGLDKVEFSVTAGEASKFDLSMFITEGGEQITGWVEFNSDLFDAETIDRMIGHYEVLLAAVAADPALRVSELSLLTTRERDQVILGWNGSRVEAPHFNLHQLFEQQVERTPDAVACVVSTERWTYAELNARANQVAHYIHKRGAGAEVLVGIYSDRNIDLLTGVLGILKSGSAYVPLDPSYPKERLGYVLQDSQARLVLTQSSLADSLPSFQGELICLDTKQSQIAEEPTTNPAVDVDLAHLAYVLFTSGSTGRPKGVALEHRSVVTFVAWAQGLFTRQELAGVLFSTSICFDLSVFEIFVTLSSGGKILVVENALYLSTLEARNEVTLINTVPSAIAELVRSGGVPDSVKTVNLAGEALRDELVEQIYAGTQVERVYNLYGPTEDTTYSTYTLVPRGTPVTIGKPIANTQAYILDAHLHALPVGVPGELYLAGDGLARGYYGRPDLTEQRFVANPFGTSPRMYRTGDLCRWLPNGQIQYLGRADQQVKIRGFRIELGEIETVLAQHPAVQQCALLAREDQPGDKRLVAYVVPDPHYRGSADSGVEGGLGAEQVSQWGMTFDESYREGGDAAEATFNISGWKSSYTGQAIPAEEMRVWVETTVERIMALKPKRVWEIGCGTGLLLFRIAPNCEHYHGTDVSATAIRFLGEQLRRPDLDLSQVTLACKPAHEFDPNPDQGKFDLVVLNSVIQYFPDWEYLVQVLTSAVDSISTEGSVFIGDVRSFPLLKTFHTSVELHNAPDGLTRAQLLQRVEKAVRQDGELLVDPAFFSALQRRIPRIGRVHIQLKRGWAANELTRFRYDVVLYVETPAEHIAEVNWLDWTRQGFTVPMLSDVLEKSQPGLLCLANVPNARLYLDVAATQMLDEEYGPANVGELRERLKLPSSVETVEPEALWNLEKVLPYRVEIRPSHSGVDGYNDVVLERHDPNNFSAPRVLRFPGESDLVRPWETYCNNPLRQSVARALVPQIRTWLAERVPEFMVPAAVVLLDSMPLSANGKINRRALPQPEYAREESIAYIAPRTYLESQLAAIWSEVLHVPQIGVKDNFFSLGGHSLLVTQVVSRIRTTFRVELPLRNLFETPTVEELSIIVETLLRQQDAPKAPGLRKRTRDRALPLSFAQQRLWFLDQLEPNTSLYNAPSIMRLHGPLDAGILGESLSEVAQRHETLRTHFEVSNGEPVQIVDAWKTLQLAIVDIGDLPQNQREEEARRLAIEEADRPFNLGEGPLVRATLIRLSAEDHVFVLNTHHAISDGWSLEVFWRELAALYDARLTGRPLLLPELTLQYADYALWQREFLAGEERSKQLEYWKHTLNNAPPVLELPTDRPRPMVETFRGDRHSVLMPTSLLEALRDLSQREGVTLFMVLLAAWSTLLARYSGQEDIVVGSPISGRNHAELENLIGLFVNTLVLRTSLAGNPTFRQLLARVRETTLGAYGHQDTPFEQLVEELQPERDLSRNPIFQVMLVLINVPSSARHLGEATAEPFQVRKHSSKFDLTLYATEQADGLRLAFEYNTDLFDASTIERFSGSLTSMLQAAVQNPGMEAARLPLLSDSDRAYLIGRLNDTRREYPQDRTLSELFTATVERSPDALACLYGERNLTYRELEARSSQFAHFLLRKGVAAGTLVGVCLQRTPDLLITLLGILKTGAAYLPLDPAYPHDRLRYIVEDSGTRLIVAEEAVLNSLPEYPGETVCLDRVRDEIHSQPADIPQLAADPQALAYVLHTSGSTGNPKGVAVTQRNLINFLWSMRQEPGMKVGDRLLAVTTLSFDISGLELYLPLITGASVVLASREEAVDAVRLIGLLENFRINVMQATPATWTMLLEAGWPGDSALKVLCGGEALSQSLASQLLQRCGELWNMYGPTETTIWSSVSRITRDNVAAITIGAPIANTSMYVLDKFQQLVPPGVSGELYIGGDGVARGYWNRPEMTAERFVTDPFVPGGRMYRTGDLARVLRGGTIQCLGRIDFQVKVRGFRIELGEIEAVLGAQPEVAECVVMVREDEPGDRRIVAYLVARGEISTTALRGAIGERLPEYMVPTRFVVLSALPQTANGKIDRKALPAPDQAPTAEGRAPSTVTEGLLTGIWAEVLKVERVGVEENFFALGGHSLLAMRMVARIRQAFGVELPVRTLFELPTVAGLASVIDGLTKGASPGLTRVERGGPLALSFAQQRLWWLDQLEPGRSVYNVPRLMWLHGSLGLDRLETSLNAITHRHEVLRTHFSAEGGRAVQVVEEEAASALRVVDLSGGERTPEEARCEAMRVAQLEAAEPFDLEHGPLLRVLVVKVSQETHLLVVTMHHIVTDRWSMGVLWRELAAFYTDGVTELPELAFQYADYAAWQRQWLQGEVLAEHVEYWKARLAGAPLLLELPMDRPRPAATSDQGAALRRELHPATLGRLRALSRQQGATLFMTLLACFKTLLLKYTGQEDLVVATVVAGRSHAEIEPLIGFFVNTLALRTDMAGDPSFVTLLGRIRESALDAYAHGEVPFEKLVEELNPPRSLSYPPVVQVAFAQDQTTALTGLPGLQVEAVASEQITSVFDMNWTVVEHGEGARLYVEYRTALFDESTVARMIGHFETLLEGVSANPEARLSELAILSAAEEHQLLVEWNDTAAEYPRERCVHELFEEWAERTPDARALVYEDETLSYSELNRRANRLAWHLLKNGLQAGDLVGVYLERSAALVETFLAVQKCGAAYVPLDPGYPAERLRAVMEDAGPVLMVTEHGLRGGMPAFSGPVVCLEDAAAAIGDEEDRNLGRHVAADNLMYVLFTSGSTGRPKGVAVPHRGVVNYLYWVKREFGITPADVTLVLASFSFDMSVQELYLPLLTGGMAVVTRPYLGANGPELAELMKRHGVSFTMMTPTSWSILLQAGYSGAGIHRIIAGEPLPRDLFRQLMEAAPATPLYNMYGPTETTVVVLSQRLTDAEDAIVIGRPISNTQIYLLDKYGKPVPVGVPGRVYIGGDGVTRGYLGQPELTAEKFGTNPFGGRSLLYDSGDVARYLADGRIEYLGRADLQVKIRGLRIELGEIEAVLARHPAVAEAVVTAREDDLGTRYLAAYAVAAEAGTPLDFAKLRAYVKAHVPDYMVPSGWMQMERMPVSPTGKVDRQALPAPADARARERLEEAARTPVEEMIAAIFCDVLQLEAVGVGEDFFELGGHSLTATQVVSRLQTSLGVKVPLRLLFEAPTVEGLADRLNELRHEAQGGPPPPIMVVGRDRPLPLSYAQQRLWFMGQMEPESSLFNAPLALRLRGALNVDALHTALDALVARHEVLRTTYELVGDEPVQRIHPAGPVSVAVVDLRGRPTAEIEAQALLDVEVQRPFRLTKEVLRVSLVLIEEQESALLVNLHHIASDGWSNGVLLRDLSTLYAAALRGESAALPELAVQYADYAVWQREWLQGKVLAEQMRFWKDTLEGAPAVLDLPADRPRPDLQTYRGGLHVLEIPADRMIELRTLGRRENVTPFMLLLAAFQVMISYLVKQMDVVLGTDLANRGNVQTEELIGFFVNLLVLRGDLSGDPAFTGLLERTRTRTLDAYAHQEVPFDKLVEELQPERSRSHNPLVQVLFVQQNTPRSAATMEGLEVSGVRLALPSKFDLAVFVRETEQGLRCAWQYNADLFDAATIERMGLLYGIVLESVVANPQIRLSHVFEQLTAWEVQENAARLEGSRELSRQKLKRTRRAVVAVE